MSLDESDGSVKTEAKYEAKASAIHLFPILCSPFRYIDVGC
jgi:hypothetical protein